MNQRARAWLHSMARLTPVVAGVSAAAVAGLVAFRGAVPPSELRAATDAVGNYLQTVGGIYAVLLAFVVYAVWGQFNDARGFVDREATALVDLHRTASALPTATRDEIQRGIRDYTDAVIADEWHAMARADEATIERVGELLDRVWIALHRCRPANDCQHAVYTEVLTRFNDLTYVRTSRLTSARTRIPIVMKLLLYLGAIIVIGSIYLLGFDELWIHATVTAALAGAIAHVLFLILDLDDAFAGNVMVSQAPFVRARRHFDRATHLADADAA
jgi:hypothetical protein